MKKIQLVCLVSVLMAGVVQAATPCDGFQIKVKNNLLDNLAVTTVKLNGAEIKHGGLQMLDSKAETVFIVEGSDANRPMTGELIFHTITLPSKTVHLNFDLSNQLLVCSHVDHSTNDDYSVGVYRLPGQVMYSINH